MNSLDANVEVLKFIDSACDRYPPMCECPVSPDLAYASRLSLPSAETSSSAITLLPLVWPDRSSDLYAELSGAIPVTLDGLWLPITPLACAFRELSVDPCRDRKLARLAAKPRDGNARLACIVGSDGDVGEGRISRADPEG
jgi:hypothetical protein